MENGKHFIVLQKNAFNKFLSVKDICVTKLFLNDMIRIKGILSPCFSMQISGCVVHSNFRLRRANEKKVKPKLTYIYGEK